MISNFKKIKEFHDKFGVGRPKSPQFPNDDLVKLRIDLIQEEFDEIKVAIENKDIENLAKEITDSLVVLYGMGDVFGINLDRTFEEVHRSNMSKLGDDGKPVYREDGKILKGPNYSPADMSIIWEDEEMTNAEKLEKIKSLIKNYIDFEDYVEEDGSIDVYGHSGGNIDDAFEMGASQALGELSRDIDKILKD